MAAPKVERGCAWHGALLVALLVAGGVASALLPRSDAETRSEPVTLCGGGGTGCDECVNASVGVLLTSLQPAFKYAEVTLQFQRPSQGAVGAFTGDVAVSVWGLHGGEQSTMHEEVTLNATHPRALGCEGAGAPGAACREVVELLRVPLVRYDSYRVQATFLGGSARAFCDRASGSATGWLAMTVRTRRYSVAELVARYALLGVTVLAAALSVRARTPASIRSFEHAFSLALLGALVWLDDPLALLQVFAPSPALAVYASVVAATFAALLLFFLLVSPSIVRINAARNAGLDPEARNKVVSSPRQRESNSTFSKVVVVHTAAAVLRRHYLKAAAVLALWAFALAFQVDAALSTQADPSLDPSRDLGLTWALYGAAVVVLLFSAAAALAAARAARQPHLLGQSDRFLLFANALIVLCGFAAACGAGQLFMLFALNAYVLTLVHAFHPKPAPMVPAAAQGNVEIELHHASGRASAQV